MFAVPYHRNQCEQVDLWDKTALIDELTNYNKVKVNL